MSSPGKVKGYKRLHSRKGTEQLKTQTFGVEKRNINTELKFNMAK